MEDMKAHQHAKYEPNLLKNSNIISADKHTLTKETSV